MTSHSTQPQPAAAPGSGRSPEDPFTAEHHIHEPHKVGLPPMGPYLTTLWRRREFAFELSRTRLRAQHFNTAFGQLWLLINPLLLAAVYFVLVDILRGGDRGSAFLAHLVAGIFALEIVRGAMQSGVKSVVSGGKLILNTAFPRMLLPLSAVISSFTRFLPTIGIYLALHLILGLPWTVHMLWAIPIVGLLVLLAAGLTILVAAGQVYFRDLSNFLPYALRLWLYVSPILYYAHEVPARYQILLDINPVAPLLTAWSAVLTEGAAPAAGDLLLGAAWAGALFVAGSIFFMSREREFAVRI